MLLALNMHCQPSSFMPRHAFARGTLIKRLLLAHAQDVKLFSADGTVCLIPQGDGNLVITFCLAERAQHEPCWLFTGDATHACHAHACMMCEQVLYNVALLRTYGSATAASAIWASGTYGTGSAPFTLTLQPVSGAVLPCRVRAVPVEVSLLLNTPVCFDRPPPIVSF